ncbi:MAG: hypothetical protein ABFS56_27845 [Pseudomonadota bacterium]
MENDQEEMAPQEPFRRETKNAKGKVSGFNLLNFGVTNTMTLFLMNYQTLSKIVYWKLSLDLLSLIQGHQKKLNETFLNVSIPAECP